MVKQTKFKNHLVYETNFEAIFYAINFFIYNGKVQQIDIYIAAD